MNTYSIVVYALLIGFFIFDLWVSLLNYNNRKQTIPNIVSNVYGTEEYKKWLAYTMEKFRVEIFSKVLNVLIFLILLVSGAFVWFQGYLEGFFVDGPLLSLTFLWGFYVITSILELPLHYYSAFLLEQKYGFNRSTLKLFIIDQIKSLLLMTIFGGLLLYLFIVIDEHLQSNFVLLTWSSLVVIMFTINLIYVPVIIPLFNKLTPLEDGELKNAIHEFAKKTGYEISKISVIDASKRSSRLNAYFVGFGNTKRIVLYDTLVEKMSVEEIVAVLAHEIGHAKNHHIWYQMGLQFLILLVYLYLFNWVLHTEEWSTSFGFETSNFAFSLIIFLVLLKPISLCVGIVSNYFSRKNEYEADAYSAMNVSPSAIETALKTLAKQNFSNLTPHPLYVKLTYSHPPIADRIEAIRKVSANEKSK
jgi:STE24 endopeptidase